VENIKNKIKLIREIENDIGYEKFRVNENSNEEDINSVLEFIYTSYSSLETYLDRIDEILTPTKQNN